MTFDELKKEVNANFLISKPHNWRNGQFVFNYINENELFTKSYKRVFKHKMKATDTNDLFVITAYTTPHDKDAFVKLYICNKGEVYNASYIGFKVNNLDEANSLISYLSTNLVSTLLLLRKQSISISKLSFSKLQTISFSISSGFSVLGLSLVNIT